MSQKETFDKFLQINCLYGVPALVLGFMFVYMSIWLMFNMEVVHEPSFSISTHILVGVLFIVFAELTIRNTPWLKKLRQRSMERVD